MPRAFWVSHALWPLLVVILAEYFLEYQKVDILISRYFFDSTTHSFPLRFDYLFKNILHGYLNYLTGIAVCFLLGFLLLTWREKYRAYRSILLYLLTSIFVSSVAVIATKMSSIRACAWDLQVFGGAYPLLSWFDVLPEDLKPGRCWPGGFATAGFCLFAFYFAARRHLELRTAFLSLAIILLYGNVLGIVQVMRGAHLFSHHIWTAIICWYVSLLCFAAYQYRLKGENNL